MPRVRRSIANADGSPQNSPNRVNQNSNNQNLNNNQQNLTHFPIQKIPFLPAHPAAWFRIIENQFTAARVNQEAIKFNHAISMLDSAMIEKCIDLIENLDANTPYTTFKTGVISRMAQSEQSRLQTVLLGTELGDQKPSELLSKMQSLAADQIKPEAIKTLWLQRLPSQVRAILAVSSEDLPQLAQIGDKILETVSYQSIAATSSSASVSEIPKASKMEDQISQLTKEFSRFRNDFQSFKNSNRDRSRSRSKSNDRQDKICYYHKKFGINAKKCTRWCTFSDPNMINSGNDRARQK